jgi:hypothetical protein
MHIYNQISVKIRMSEKQCMKSTMHGAAPGYRI